MNKKIRNKMVSSLIATSLLTGVITPVSASASTVKLTTKSATAPQQNNTGGNTGNQEVSKIPYTSPVKTKIRYVKLMLNADNQLEQDIAVALVLNRDKLDLSKYEAIPTQTLFNAITKAYTQNPIAMDLNTFTYYAKPADGKPYVQFNYLGTSRDTIARHQLAVMDEVENTNNNLFQNLTTDEAKVKALYDYFDKNYEYDNLVAQKYNTYKTLNTPAMIPFLPYFTSYGILSVHRAVCQGFTAGFKLILDQANIPNYVVMGRQGGVNHTWMKIKVNDTWYNYDVTQTQRDMKVPYPVYKMTDNQIKSFGYTPSTSFIMTDDIPTIATPTTEADYYTTNKLVKKDIKETVSYITSNLKSKKPKSQFVVKMTSNPTASTFKKEMTALVTNVNKANKDAYTKAVKAEQTRKANYDAAVKKAKASKGKIKAPAKFVAKSIKAPKTYYSYRYTSAWNMYSIIIN